MVDILEMLNDSIADRNFLHGDAKATHQRQGVLIGSVRCAEAGHGYADDMGAVNAEIITGFCAAQQCQRGIQTAGNANHQRIGMGMLHASCKACCLDGENIFAACIQLCGWGEGDIGQGSAPVVQCGVLCHIEENLAIEFLCLCFLQMGHESGVLSALAHQHFYVDIGINKLAFAREGFCFREKRTIFVNHAVSAEYSVLCGFACACGGVYISGQAARGLLRHQLTAIAGLGGKLIACGKIQQQRCAVQAQIGAGGNGYPEVFADFYADFQCREIRSGENQVCADGNILPCISNFFRQKVIRRGKPAFLIKFAIVGDMCFGDDTQKLALVEGNSAVEHLIIHSDGRTNQEEDIQCFCCFCNLLNCLLGGVQKRCLKEQIRTGIACNGKLWEGQHTHLLCGGCLHQLQDFLFIIDTIGNPQLRYSGTDLYITIHTFISP